MSFASPAWLLVLLALPVLLLARWLARRRATRYAARFPAFATLREAARGTFTWRRQLPAVLLLAAIAVLALTLARPRETRHTPIRAVALVLVLDHSGSMASTDVQPTRLAAADAAANTFIGELPASAKVGVVTFSTTPDAAQVPSTDHSLARRVIDAQVADGSTDTGDALQQAITMLEQLGPHRGRTAIVLLSDGAANAGPSPVSVATEAGHEDIAIDTVALGTPDGVLQTGDPVEPEIPVPPDPALMQAIASASGGQSFDAQDAGHLTSIYRGLGTQLGSRVTRHDITATFAIVALALLALAGLAAVRWAGRLP